MSALMAWLGTRTDGEGFALILGAFCFCCAVAGLWSPAANLRFLGWARRSVSND